MCEYVYKEKNVIFPFSDILFDHSRGVSSSEDLKKTNKQYLMKGLEKLPYE